MADEQYTVSVILSAVDQNLTSTLSRAESQIKGFQNSLNNIPNQIGNAGKAVSNLGNSISNVGNAVSRVGLGVSAVMAPVAVATKKATDNFRDFDEGLIKVGKTSDIRGQKLQSLGQDFIKLGADVGTPIPDLLELGEVAGQLFDTTKDVDKVAPRILNFTKVMSKMARTTDVAGQEGAKSMMNFLNTVGLGIDQSEELGSALVHLGNNANTTEGQILRMAERMGLSGKMAGFSAPQVLALATTFSEFGIEAQRGASGFRMFSSEIDKGVAEGGAKLQKYAELSKMSASEFAQAWKNEPVVALEHLLNGFQEAIKNGETSSLLLQELGFNGQFAQETFRALSDSIKESGGTEDEFVGKLIDNLELAQEGWTNAKDNFLNQEFEQAMESINYKVQTLKSTFEGMTDTLGVMLKPAIVDILDTFTGSISNISDRLKSFYETWNSWDDNQKENWGKQILLAGSFALALGPMIAIGGRIINGIGKITSGIGSLISTFGDLTQGIGDFANLIIQQGKGVLDTTLAIKDAFLNFGPVSDVFGVIEMAGSNLADTFTEKFPVAGEVFDAFGLAVKGGSEIANLALKTVAPAAMIGAILATIGLLPDGAREHLINFANTAKEKGPEFITNLTNGIAQKIPELVSKGAEVVISFTEAIATNLPALIVGGAKMIASLVVGVAQNADMLIASAINVVGGFFKGIVGALPILLQAGLQMLISLIGGIADNIPLIFQTAGEIISGLVQGIAGNLPQIIMTGITIIGKLIEGILMAIPNIFKAGLEIIKGLGNGIKEGFSTLTSGMGGKLKDFVGTETTYASEEGKVGGENIGSSINDGLSTAVEGTGLVFDGLSSSVSAGLNNVSGIIGGNSSNWYETLTNNSKLAVDAGSNVWNEFNPYVKGALDTTTSTVDESTRGLRDTVVRNTEGMADGMASNFQLGLDSILSSSQNVSTIVPSDASSMNEQTVAQYQTMSKNIQNAMLDAEMYVRIGSERISEHFVTMSTQIPQLFENLGTKMGSSMDNVFTSMQHTVSNALLTIQTTTYKVTGNIVNTFTQTLNQLPNNTRVVLNKVNSQFTNSMNTVNNTMSNSLKKMNNDTNSNLNQIANIFNSKFNNINQVVNRNLTSVENTVKSKMNSIDNVVKSKNQSMQNIFNTNLNKIEQLVKSKFNSIENQYKQTFNQLNSTTISGFNQMSSSFNQATNNMLRGFSQFGHSISSQARNIVNNLINIMRSAYGGMYSAGSYAGQGFRNGLAGMSGSIMVTARNIANSVTATISRALSIHSPSKETTELGKYTGEGFVNGLASMINDSIKTSRKLAFDSMGAIADVMPPFIELVKTFTGAIKTLIKDAENQVVSSTNNIVDALDKTSNSRVSVTSGTRSENRVHKTKLDNQRELEDKRKEAERAEQQRLENIQREADRVRKEAISSINNVNSSLETIHKLQEETIKLDQKHTDNILGSATAYNKSLRKLKTMTTKADLIPEIPIDEVQAEIEHLDFEGIENRFTKMNENLLSIWDENKAILYADDETAIALASDKVDYASQGLIKSLKGVDTQSTKTIASVSNTMSTVADNTIQAGNITRELSEGLNDSNADIENVGKLISNATNKSIQDLNKLKRVILQNTVDINELLVPVLNDYSKLFGVIILKIKTDCNNLETSLIRNITDVSEVAELYLNNFYNDFMDKIKKMKSESISIDTGNNRDNYNSIKTLPNQIEAPNNKISADDLSMNANLTLVMGNQEYTAYVKDIRNETERQERLEGVF